jgi:hypothetical protein
MTFGTTLVDMKFGCKYSGFANFIFLDM